MYEIFSPHLGIHDSLSVLIFSLGHSNNLLFPNVENLIHAENLAIFLSIARVLETRMGQPMPACYLLCSV